MTDGLGTVSHHDGVFIEIDEEDPIVALQLRAMTDDGDGFIAGGFPTEPGRYELRRVDDAD